MKLPARCIAVIILAAAPLAALAQAYPTKPVRYGLFAPAGTPGAVVSKIEADVAALVENKALRSGLAQRGAEMTYGNSAQFTAVVKGDLAKRARVVKETGAKAD